VQNLITGLLNSFRRFALFKASFYQIIALVIGGIIWGLPGIFLAIPLMAMFKIVCDHIEPLKSYGFLIGEIENKKGDHTFIRKINSWYKKKQHK